MQTLDLRAEAPAAGDGACGPSERLDPDTGRCAPCLPAGDPRESCPCGFTYEPAPFPSCEGPEGAFRCDEACRGDVTTCNALAPDGTVTSCARLRDCCARLAREPDSTPCCAEGASLVCTAVSRGAYPLAWSCLDSSCCGAPCSDDSGCDARFQRCSGGRCLPGCDTDREYCFVTDSACECRPSDPV